MEITMKFKTITTLILTATFSMSAQAFWGNNNFFGNNNGWGNDWPVWTPMYWMEEFTGNNDYNNYYGNVNPWNGNPMTNMPFNTNPWSNAPMNSLEGNYVPNGYSPYVGGGPNAGYPQGYPQGYRPLPGYQNMPLVPSKGPTSFRP